LSLRRTALGILLGAMMGLSGCEQTPPETHADTSGVRKPTQILKDFEMNDVKDGSKTMTLISIEGRIYEDQNVADVDKPLIHFFKLGKESSRLKAPEGRVKMDTHEVETWGGVTVVSADSTTLTTERLRYEPKTQEITSTNTVHLEKPDSITDGIGLVTDPDLKKVKIGHEKVTMKKGKHL